MIKKYFEVRDAGTCIVVLAMKTTPSNNTEKLFLERGGWDTNTVILMNLTGLAKATYDPFDWQAEGSRTLFEAHFYIQKNFDILKDFDIIDIQYILGETDSKKLSNITYGYEDNINEEDAK